MLNPAAIADFRLSAENQYHSGFPAMHLYAEKNQYPCRNAVIRYSVGL